jgi:Spy/CpxP family protein refolding chaperone
MNKWYVASAVSGLLAMAAVVWAEPQREVRGGEGERPAPRGERMEKIRSVGSEQAPAKVTILRALMQSPELARSVGLTEEQVKAIRDAAFAHREAMVGVRAEAERARLAVERLQEADKPDEAALMKAIDEAGLKETAMRKAEAAFELKVKGLIGPEVAAKIRERIAARMERARMEGGEARPEFRGREGGEGRPRAPWMQERMEEPMEDAPPPRPARS